MWVGSCCPHSIYQVWKSVLFDGNPGKHSITLSADGHLTLNDSHIIVKRLATSDGETTAQLGAEERGELIGVYTAPGYSTFNSTHVVKKDSSSNETTAVLAVMPLNRSKVQIILWLDLCSYVMLPALNYNNYPFNFHSCHFLWWRIQDIICN